MASVSWIGNMADSAIGRSSTLMLGYLGCHVTAALQLLREVNKFLLA